MPKHSEAAISELLKPEELEPRLELVVLMNVAAFDTYGCGCDIPDCCYDGGGTNIGCPCHGGMDQ